MKRFLIAVILIGSVARFVGLETSPPAFYVDEAAVAINMICLSQTGHGEFGDRLPLFFVEFDKNSGGFFTPIYMYFGALWVKIFGVSIYAFRALSAFFSVLTLLGLFFLTRELVGSEAALWATLVGTLSPWSFQFARIAWDAAAMPCFLVWGLYFFFKSQKLSDAFWAAVFLTFACYTYAPARAAVPLLVLVSIFLKQKIQIKKQTFPFKFLAIFAVTALIVGAPLLTKILSGELQGRFNFLSVFSPDYIYQQFGDRHRYWGFILFFKNVLAHLTPRYLFFQGDGNLRHSTQLLGEWGWLEISSFFALIFLMLRFPKKLSPSFWRIVAFGFLGFLIGIIPAALTWEGVPHALRSSAGWPFVALWSGIIWWQVSQMWPVTKKVAVGIIIFYSGYFGYAYFIEYPRLAPAWFDEHVQTAALQGQKTGDWSEFKKLIPDYFRTGLRYHLVRYHGDTCQSSGEQIDRWRTELENEKK